jgi:hypothetical protein
MSQVTNSGNVLEFDETTHTYSIAGARVPSVTEILGSCGIVDYSHLPPETREMALARGRAVHEAIALDIMNDLDEASAEEAGVMGYVEAARGARINLGLGSASVEQRVWHPLYRYAGTLDLLAGELLIDWKTGTVESWVRYQLAAYSAAVSAAAGLTAHGDARIRRIAVELHADSSYRIYELSGTDQLDDFQTFLCALQIWRAKNYPKEMK